MLLTLPARGESDLRRVISADLTAVDPHLVGNQYETIVTSDLFEGLTVYGPDASIQPGVAERWDVAPDGKSYTFHLRPGLTWSDGSPLTAAEAPNHFLDLEDFEGRELPTTRWEAIALLQELKKKPDQRSWASRWSTCNEKPAAMAWPPPVASRPDWRAAMMAAPRSMPGTERPDPLIM